VVDVEMEDSVLPLPVSTIEEVETQDLPQTDDFGANFVNYTEQDESMTEEAHAAALENEIDSEQQSVDLLADDSQE
jgi:hypothetical protein